MSIAALKTSSPDAMVERPSGTNRGYLATSGYVLPEGSDVSRFLQSGAADLREANRRVIVASDDRNAEADALIAKASLEGVPVLSIDQYSFGLLMESLDRTAMTYDAGHRLYMRDKINSALHGIRPWQFILIASLFAVAGIAAFLDWYATLSIGAAAMILLMAALVVFRFVTMTAGVVWQLGRTDAQDTETLTDADLPTYSVLVPMLRERESTLRGLVESLSRLDYPIKKLQVLFILEDTDSETRAIVDDLVLPDWFQVVLIPDAAPHTKGKACNYAMNFVTGQLFTIYDAEDHPDPLQLKKAVAAFRRADDDVVCVQSRLNFYNVKENWLTRMFTLDYSTWYYYMLPGMDKLSLPICLGGTSNHFKSRIVRDLCDWDAYNVTEDADLGLRIAKSGYRTVLVDSVTYEEAVTKVPNWIRQRTRWIKGYMLTYLIHMRQPFRLLRETGLWGFIGIQLFVAGNFLGNLIILPLLVLTAAWAAVEVLGTGTLDLLPPALEYTAATTFIVGNACAIGFAMAAGIRRGFPSLALYALTLPAYWLLSVVATYRALWQVIFSPYKWEKTEHGVTSVSSDTELGKLVQPT